MRSPPAVALLDTRHAQRARYVVKDLPHRGRGDPDAQDEQFAVDAPVPHELFSRARRWAIRTR
jgi:hypothetical protein